MANSGLQLLGFAMALLGWIGTIVATVLPQWKMSAYVGANIITAQAVYQGLWMTCNWQSTGIISCEVYKSMLNLPPSVQATRALMVISVVLGVVAMFVAAMGMKCTRCGSEDKAVKARIAMTGGIVFLVAGLASLIACSWIGNQIVQEFYAINTPVNGRYEFGPAVFIGWASAALLILGGSLLSCSCPGKNGYSGQYPKSKAISKPPSREYV